MTIQADPMASAITLQKAVLKITAGLQQAIDQKGLAVLAVCGGSSPLPLFAALQNIDIDWDCVTVTLVDDRDVPADHPDSNQKLISEHLLQKRASRAKWQNLHNFSQRQIDVAILGMGTDGHFASLFPAMLDDPQAFAVTAKPAILRTAVMGTPAHRRLSMNVAMLASADSILLLISGAEKEKIVRQAYTDSSLPVYHMLHLRHSKLDIVALTPA